MQVTVLDTSMAHTETILLSNFMKQLERAVEIAEMKYPKDQGLRQHWIFDNSSCHNAMAESALNVNKMNVNSGGLRISYEIPSTMEKSKEWSM